ncbi:MAG: hypothetical protein ACYC4L_04805 [Chloroflexota bacterium]
MQMTTPRKLGPTEANRPSSLLPDGSAPVTLLRLPAGGYALASGHQLLEVTLDQFANLGNQIADEMGTDYASQVAYGLVG